jgi:hypothetical protein
VAPVLAELRAQATGRSRTHVPTDFEGIVGRDLRRQVFMFEVTSGGFNRLRGTGYGAGMWIAKREHVKAWFRHFDSGQLAGRLGSARDRVEALLPIIGESGEAVCMVAIGRRFLRRLSSRERSLVEAAVGMAVLLMQQAELQQQVETAGDISATVQRIAASHGVRIGLRSYLDSSRN